MTQFRATIEGNRGVASRLGSKSSGMRADVNGWDIGVQVFASFDTDTGEDVFHVYLSGGSNRRSNSRLVGKFTESDLYRQLKVVGQD